jgi:predicted O-methyltransferase YrrM
MPKKIIPRKFWNEKNEEEVKTISQLSRTKFLQKLRIFGEEQNIPNISPTGEDVLRFFLQLKKPKKVLEIGCANGYSSCVIASEIEKFSGTLLTGDVSEPSLESAKINAQMMKLHNIEFRFGDALKVFTQDDGPFDLIFIDGQKSWTHKFFQFAAPLLAKNGIIIVDDTQKFTDKMKSFKNLIEREKENWNFFSIPDSKDDAMMVFARKEFF